MVDLLFNRGPQTINYL
ncbi:hypothetical protein [Mucilaginibacter humi]|nr:hypothetical protein [Mucilaginibacter humi]